ncbi:hypothetical protein R3W88_012656 [Solanum pinnatisectum]|uniref:Uncharacterized protein n=1 Tax=Solanum pinnatisectum TaxID=50273 RepID=A0AAV9LAB3_9SOLN|nr:hypothetical protein R3W88_012656 [Solanum pinnatisectum]
MASVTNDSSSATVADGELQAKSIPTVDLRLLSQSELYSLSVCSTTDYNSYRDDDFNIPKIDRSVFNESAASRKQTYSRIPYAPPSSSSSTRSRTPHPPSPNNGTENSQVIALIKHLFGYPTDSVPNRVDHSDSLSAPMHVLESANVGSIRQKKNRGRPGKNENGRTNKVVKHSVV